MRSVLIGTVESTAVAFESLVAVGAAPELLVTLSPQHAGRHSDYVDLASVAMARGVRVVNAADVNDPSVVDTIRAARPDVLWVVGWSQLLGRELLDAATFGAIGFHPAPLPRNRGRAVIPWTILQRAANTAATLFWLDDGIDTGDLIAQHAFDVAPDETAGTLYAKHLAALGPLIGDVVTDLRKGVRRAVAQDHASASYCARRVSDDGFIDWSRSADDIWTLIRAVGRPYPGAFTFLHERELRVWAADLVGAARHSGVVGQAQAVDDSGALVRCGDGNHIRISVCQLDGGEPGSALGVIRRHDRLGPDMLRLHRSVMKARGS